jgi:hypothetical protein
MPETLSTLLRWSCTWPLRVHTLDSPVDRSNAGAQRIQGETKPAEPQGSHAWLAQCHTEGAAQCERGGRGSEPEEQLAAA